DENKYIASASLNGKTLTKTYITHQDIINGGVLAFNMSNQPSTWGTKAGDEPKTDIEDYQIVPVPFIVKGDVAFKGSTEVALQNVDNDAAIYYRIGHKGGFKKYERPFTIDKAISVSVYSEKNSVKSATATTEFYKIDPNISISLETQ